MNSNRSSVLVPFLLGATFVSTGCNSGGTGGSIPPVNVEVQRVQAADEDQAFAYSGTIEESESIPLSFAVVGSVARVLVSEGDFVNKGQPLALLNEESYRNTYEMALASEKQADDACRRLQPMYRNGNLPEVKLVEVESDLERARSAATIARKNLEDCTLRSPVEGIVGRRSVEPGMNALPNITTITIVRIAKVYARVPVSEREIALIRKGERASITVAALGDPEFEGTVEEIGVLADPLAHTYKIRIGIANPKLAIKPGMICSVLIHQVRQFRGVVVAGPAVMVDESGRHYVYIVDSAQGAAVRKLVTPGALLNNGIEILAGLQCGEPVVVAGQHKLAEGTPVRVVNH